MTDENILYEGYISRCLQFTSEEGRAYVTLNVKDIQQSGEQDDEHIMLFAAGLFKYVMNQFYSKHKLQPGDVNIILEIPEEAFTPEVRATLDRQGMTFKVSSDPIKNSMPVINIVGEDEEE